MKKEYEFSGDITGKSKIIIDEDKIIIERKGILSALSKGLPGSKSIRINQITGTQYKKAGMAIGFLQFIIKGSQEIKGGIQAARQDENTVVWGNKYQNEYAEEIINYINDFNNEKESNNSNNVEDKYDKLAKLKNLLDNNIITQEEFDNEKQKILNQ